MTPSPASFPSAPERPRLPAWIPALGLLCCLLAHILSPRAASAQNVVVDQGTFLLSLGGQAIGTETFTIRRSGAGASSKLIATGEVRVTVESRERILSSALEATGPESVVTAYQLKEGGDLQSEVYMTLSGRRFQARLVSPEGEQVREHRATPRIVLLEQWLAHHYHLVSRRASSGESSLPVLVPRTGETLEIRIVDAGTERIQIAGQTVQARHLRLEEGQVERDLWVDEEGRVLRIMDQNTGFRAERRDLPG